MSPENTNTTICPTCGSPVKSSATRCLVCGTGIKDKKPTKQEESVSTIKSPRMPEVTLNLPLALGIMVILLAIGAGVVYALTANAEPGSISLNPTDVPTETATPTKSATPTATETGTPEPTFTQLPPIEYTISDGDLCSGIAAYYDVSVKSIADLNNLPIDCGLLSIGNKLLVPQPTITSTPVPTNTLSIAEATDSACQKFDYVVAEFDTLAGIAANYSVSMESIKNYNGKTSDTVFVGEHLSIPLCERLPTAGPTPTATNPPPYTASNLLLPADGEVFSSSIDTVSLQWASNITLLQNEAYKIVVEDLTEGKGKKLIQYVTDTKFIVPTSFRPIDSSPHIIRWYIEPVRQNGTLKDGSPIWDSAGAISEYRVFSWYSETVITATFQPTETPSE
ncbi:MAG: LysM peptidoglycan-binding domain-containing protein [Anaerolineaceae bacterium]|nr:LysM peptidoglycan-binding domain-containing protein [Anaerolineaceae bacterium]